MKGLTEWNDLGLGKQKKQNLLDKMCKNEYKNVF